MAEQHDKDSKTEEATEKKLRDSIEKGRVPYSREAASFASIIGMMIAMFLLIGDNAIRLRFSLEGFIDNPGDFKLENGADAMLLMKAALSDVGLLLFPVLLVIALSGIAGSIFQNQPQFALERITPEWSRISLTQGFGRIFGAKGQVEFLKALFKVLIVGFAGYLALVSSHQEFVNALFMEPSLVPGLMQGLIMRFLGAVATAIALLVAADLVWSRISWRRDLRMTKQEVKDEMKQTEGDPLVKMRVRSLQRDRARKRMIAAVPRATLVVANPTHFSVALRYVREEGGAPIVVAKGQDLIALRIRQIAEENGIPVYEDRTLARALYASVEVDRMIPAEFYKAVASIILLLASRGKTAKKPITN